ncbi:hypothetical protein AVEN_109302-1 [Araneus ventricosus]|uniref:Uncharacterized protein n=1 Tax=Araneus ventricosus TaxID=182803 RepID=A0A4Y2D1B9_ARAVE|nr:hypothetical protein AVEN_109302-1 [Araneus ventricosus]
MCQTPEDTNSAAEDTNSLLPQEGPYPAKLCRTDCMKKDCSHDRLLFVCLCPQRWMTEVPETIPQMAWPARSPDLNPQTACVGHVGKTDYRSQCAARHSLRASTILTTEMGITATTNDQQHYCRHASPLSTMHFS